MRVSQSSALQKKLFAFSTDCVNFSHTFFLHIIQNVDVVTLQMTEGGQKLTCHFNAVALHFISVLITSLKIGRQFTVIMVVVGEHAFLMQLPLM